MTFGELRTAVVVCMAGVALIVIGFSFPPLTSSRGGGTARSVAIEAKAASEKDYCRKGNIDANCACFGNKSAQVQADERVVVPGVIYPDREQLARSQARRSC